MEFISCLNLIPVLFIFSSFHLDFGNAIDTITSSQFIKDPKTINSKNSRFTLGFFSPENSTNRYVGIWYFSESTVIWVANRNNPLRDSSGIVTISEDGNLVVLNGQKEVVWSSNVSNTAINSSAQLSDSGNLVLKDNSRSKTAVWESFQHPSDTMMPTMKISTDKRTGEKVQLTSWKGSTDPSIGSYSSSLEPLNVPEIFIWNGTSPYWRSGPWNGQIFTGVPEMNSVYLDGFKLGEEDEGTVYLTFAYADASDLSIFVLNSQGILEERSWNDEKDIWEVGWTNPEDECDVYGKCGTFGICNYLSSPICSCLRGYKPTNKEEWNQKNWTNGCVRRVPLQCERAKNGSEAGKGDGFLKMEMVKVPYLGVWSSSLGDKCRTQCIANCSCIAYANVGGIGCISWSGNLTDIQKFSSGGDDLYLRVAFSELDKERDFKVIIIITVLIGIIMISIAAYFLWRWTTKYRANKQKSKGLLDFSEDLTADMKRAELQELPLFEFAKLATATNDFHSANKLGQGGFGPVYKGILEDGKEVAVKRLSRASGQGLEEFMNEVVVISKLQHRNLVKLLGCCIEGDEKMLIYEYMANKSLDAFLFKPLKQKELDWRKRFNIIQGIARGLLYLHRDSRLIIIHRDLKPSNILLDEELNPKISDFGMARIFKGSEDEDNTIRVVGTYGYMSPEYAMEGLFSEKSDVFSFGVLLLEIVSGRKNTSFYDDDMSLTLLGFAWKLWNEENVTPLISLEIYDQYFRNDILRCIHIGLLCVQELARDRPTVATIISMLHSEIVNLPPPKQPAFTQRQNMLSAESSQKKHRPSSINNVTVTIVQGR
ncbi:G-type lectin S-receptor-like serine/threonine-protein kinase [Quillaja saponaria]|uniref:Receptor-like serine/threonine-protein kinase n=1 Tax=Quillaja saponaria TaxID=32244 RepID=A0AAD7M1X9_QUISA|nr:G-type lectin S-receptor-like serine/threonine-protein kinase [Quillaja saponaria]